MFIFETRHKIEVGIHKVISTTSFSIRTEIPEIHFLDEPHIIADIDTEYGIPNGLRKVSCLNDNEMWTCGNDSIMQLYNIHGKVIKSCQTKSGNKPWDISVTKTGDLLYSDDRNRTVNVVKNSQIQQMIRFESWRPLSLCNTSWGDLLIIIMTMKFINKRKLFGTSIQGKHMLFSLMRKDDHFIHIIKYLIRNTYVKIRT